MFGMPYKRNWPNPRVRPSLNREASRLGDVRVRRPSFRAQVPETHSRLFSPETRGDAISRVRNIAIRAADYQREFVLARLQKPQCCARARKIPRQLAAQGN